MAARNQLVVLLLVRGRSRWNEHRSGIGEMKMKNVTNKAVILLKTKDRVFESRQTYENKLIILLKP